MKKGPAIAGPFHLDAGGAYWFCKCCRALVSRLEA
jgi:hypothetical protein